MKISDTFKKIDEVSGLKIEVVPGIKEDRLCVTHIGKPIVPSRDFFFNKDGHCTGTGACLDNKVCPDARS